MENIKNQIVELINNLELIEKINVINELRECIAGIAPNVLQIAEGGALNH